MNPIVFANGDDTAGLVAQEVATQVFKEFPIEEIPCSVEARLESQDTCIDRFVNALHHRGAGVKISTASNDRRIISAGMGSANIRLREKAGAVAMLRMIARPEWYKAPCAVLRYGSGGFYNETCCKLTESSDGVESAKVTTQMNLTDLVTFAEMAIRLSMEHGFRIRVSSKWTISASEKLFMDRICSVFDDRHVEYERVLTDVALARIATERDGGWLWLFDNPNGDSAADIADWVDGSRSMGSQVYCRRGFSYEELSGGTAPDKMDTDLSGENFFNPVGIINAFSGSILSVNLEARNRIRRINESVRDYFSQTTVSDRSTYEMISAIAS